MTPLIAALLQNMPALVALARDLFARDNPDAPPPTDAEVHAALIAALASSLSIDAEWLRTHPEA